MLKPVAFANAFALVALGFYVGCRLLSLLAPDLLFTIGRSWFHTFDLQSVRNVAPLDTGTFLVGGVSSAVLAWITAYAGAYLYNIFAKSK